MCSGISGGRRESLQILKIPLIKKTVKYRIKVIPRASRNEVIPLGAGELKVKLTAPPVDGKANEALIDLLATYFQVKPKAIRLLQGSSSRNKLIEVLS